MSGSNLQDGKVYQSSNGDMVATRKTDAGETVTLRRTGGDTNYPEYSVETGEKSDGITHVVLAKTVTEGWVLNVKAATGGILSLKGSPELADILGKTFNRIAADKAFSSGEATKLLNVIDKVAIGVQLNQREIQPVDKLLDYEVNAYRKELEEIGDLPLQNVGKKTAAVKHK